MPLSPGTRLGVYVVSTQIGEGGMGAVYRATDTSLDRQVAIKVLPDAFAQDGERLARFEREAKTLALLNHPNIAQIHGLERAGGTPALVMELVDGPTLQDLIDRAGALAPRGRETRQAVGLPLDDVLPIARQIAGALEAAHEQGIIHRDLKPANVKVRADGMVKVLDFGLAKALDANASAAAAGTLSLSPTFTTPAMTQMGTIVGTAAYMSPEQARGKPVDRRADIWAFGIVLYEMLTGRHAFDGETVTDVLASVLTKEPDLSAVPGTWRRLIAGCLEKDPRRRVRDIADVWLLFDRDGSPPPAASSPRRGRAWPWALAAFAAGAAATWITMAGSRTAPAGVRVAFVEPPPPGTQLLAAPLVSPDGRRLVSIAADPAGKARVWTRDLGDAVAHAVDGTDGASMAFWSPDSQQLAFVAQGQVRRIAAGGGPVSLVAAASAQSGVWLPDGDLLLAVAGQGLLRVPSSGGSLRPATGLTSEALRSVQIDGLDVSPDGRLVLFSQFGGETGVYIARVDGTSKRLLYPGQQSSAVFVGGDLIVRREANVLMAQRFNAADASLVGEAFPIAEDASDFELAGGASGSLSFITGARQISHLSWFTRDGAAAGTAGPDGEYTEVGISRRGRWLGFVRRDAADGNVDVWIQALPGGAPSRLTSDPDIDHLFTIAHDEREVAWEAHAKGALTLMRRPIDGSSPAQSVRPWGKAGGPSDWSPDGRFVLYQSQDGPTGANLWNVPMGGSGDPVRLTEPGTQVNSGQFSPDGHWLAFSGLATGQAEVYVQRVEGMKLAGGPVRVSDSGGEWPLWRGDGAELFFVNRGALMAAEFRGQSDRPVGTPRVLFTTALSGSGSRGYGRKYAVSPDGQRVVAIVPAALQTPHAATVMLNWRARTSGR